MADNIVLNSGSGGATLATDEAGTPVRHYQLVKLVDGAADSEARIGGDAAQGLDVDVTRVQGTVDVGDRALRDTGKVDVAALDQYTPIDVDTGAGTVNALPVTWRKASALAVEVGTSTDPVRVDPTGTTTQPVSGTVSANLNAGSANIGDVDVLTMPAGASATAVQGTVAHDGVDAENPVKIGGQANLNERAAVVAGDRVDAWFDLLGRLVVLPGHANPEAPVTVNGSAAGLSVIAAPGASLSLYICKVTVTNRAAAENVVSLREGAAGTIRTTINCAADGGGANLDYGARGWKLPANTALIADIGAASADVNVNEYYIAA